MSKIKLTFIAAAVAVGFATPAFPQSFDPNYGTGNTTALNNTPAAPADHRRTNTAAQFGFNAFAFVPRRQLEVDPNSPTATGGGSIGYNQKLLDD